jgi:hypothetical protein
MLSCRMRLKKLSAHETGLLTPQKKNPPRRIVTWRIDRSKNMSARVIICARPTGCEISAGHLHSSAASRAAAGPLWSTRPGYRA